jgi:hypothetical protein
LIAAFLVFVGGITWINFHPEKNDNPYISIEHQAFWMAVFALARIGVLLAGCASAMLAGLEANLNSMSTG